MLNGNVYIVTGGAGGLGAATAQELASYGAAVVVSDLGTGVDGAGRDESSAKATVETITVDGGTAMAHVGDVTDTEYVDNLVRDTVAEYGRVDGAVNFAGILRDSYLTSMTDDEWEQVIDVHLGGHFTLLRRLARHWEENAEQRQQHGSDQIVGDDADVTNGTNENKSERAFLSVTSPSAIGNVGQANYSAAKAGVLGLSRTAAAELAQFDVRVNALLPIAYTRMTESFLDEDRYPPDPVAATAAFLLSENASGVSGCTIRVAGDSVGVVSDPGIERLAFSENGWTLERLSTRFIEAFGEISLDRTERSQL
jgi:NAD(P)-dependent dehydrogenase (short-subunit alcohol dehydrogenase family)